MTNGHFITVDDMPARDGAGQMNQGYDDEDGTNSLKKERAICGFESEENEIVNAPKVGKKLCINGE